MLKALQVPVCTADTNNASQPKGSVATGPMVVGGLQLADTTQNGKHYAEAAARHLVADTTHIITQQVQVCTVEASDASAYLPIGSVATRRPPQSPGTRNQVPRHI